MITQDDFGQKISDPIEEQQIDKFVCKEMCRQIHRYIKGMSGSKFIMDKFEERLKDLPLPDKEKAVAIYIDLNRRVLDGLDFKLVLVRSIANYCDTFSYMEELIGDKERMDYYLNRIKDKYVRFHQIFEEGGKYGIKDHDGRVLVHPLYDFLRTPYVYVDDLKMLPIIAEKGGKLGLILPDGNDTVVADFIYDDISLREEPPFFEARIGEKVELL